MIDVLFFSRITFSFLEATAVHCAINNSNAVTIWRHIWGAVLAVERERGRGGLLCASNKPSTPRYSPLGKPAHPTDRPTGTIKQLIFCEGLFLLFCLRLAPFGPQQSNQQNNIKNESLFLYCLMPLLLLPS